MARRQFLEVAACPQTPFPRQNGGGNGGDDQHLVGGDLGVAAACRCSRSSSWSACAECCCGLRPARSTWLRGRRRCDGSSDVLLRVVAPPLPRRAPRPKPAKKICVTRAYSSYAPSHPSPTRTRKRARDPRRDADGPQRPRSRLPPSVARSRARAAAAALDRRRLRLRILGRRLHSGRRIRRPGVVGGGGGRRATAAPLGAPAVSFCFEILIWRATRSTCGRSGTCSSLSFASTFANSKRLSMHMWRHGSTVVSRGSYADRLSRVFSDHVAAVGFARRRRRRRRPSRRCRRSPGARRRNDPARIFCFSDWRSRRRRRRGRPPWRTVCDCTAAFDGAGSRPPASRQTISG